MPNHPDFEYECGCESDLPMKECPKHKVPRKKVDWKPVATKPGPSWNRKEREKQDA